MICKKCGNPLEEGVTLCPNCGTENTAETGNSVVTDEATVTENIAETGNAAATDEAIVTENTIEKENIAVTENAVTTDEAVIIGENTVYEVKNLTGMDDGATEEESKKNNKKNNKIAKIVLAVVAVLILCLGVVLAVNASALKNFYYRTFSSPEKYHNYVVEQYIDHITDVYGKHFAIYQDYNKDIREQGVKANLKITIDKEIQNLMATLSGTDLSFLNQTAINFDTKMSEEQIGVYMDLQMNDQFIFDMKGIGDVEENKGYYQFPSLSEYYFIMNYGELMEQSGVDFTLKDIMKTVNVWKDVAPEEVERMMREYSAVVLENIQHVEKSKEELMVGEFTVPCTKLDVVITEQDLAKMKVALIEKLRSDDAAKKILEDYFNSMDAVSGIADEMESTYEAFMEEMDTVYNENSVTTDFSEDPEGKYSLWIDNQGKIAGVGIYSLEDEKYVFELYNKEEKDITATEILWGDEIAVSGTATKENGIYNATYDVKIENKDAFSFVVKDFDEKVWKEGYIKGTYELKPAKEMLADVAPTVPASLVSGISLQMAVDYNKDAYTLNTSIVNGETKWIALDVMAKIGSTTDFTKPADSDKVLEYKANDEKMLITYLKSCDLDGLVKNMEKAKLPEEFVNGMKTQVEQIQMVLELMDVS